MKMHHPTASIFTGGPWSGQVRPNYQPVPSRLIRVFAEADSEMTCADEQVTKLLGYYTRDRLSENTGRWIYTWESA